MELISISLKQGSMKCKPFVSHTFNVRDASVGKETSHQAVRFIVCRAKDVLVTRTKETFGTSGKRNDHRTLTIIWETFQQDDISLQKSF